jgi:ERCC4-type nuclease
MSEITENIQVVVDDRERSLAVVTELKKSDRVVVQIEHLLVGDYCTSVRYPESDR